MKKYFLFIVGAMLTLLAFAQSKIVVVLLDGTEYEFSAAEIDSIRYEKDGHVVPVVPDTDFVCSSIPADETGLEFEFGGWIGETNCMVSGYTGDIDSSLVIPAKVCHEGKEYDVYGIRWASLFDIEKLRRVEIPSTVRYIDTSAFRRCPNIEEFIVSPDNKYLLSIDGVVYGKNQYNNAETLVICPVTINHLDIPNTVKRIETYAFENCVNLKRVEIPDSVAVIEWDAFEGCTNLDTIVLSRNTDVWGSFPNNTVIVYRDQIDPVVPDTALFVCNGVEAEYTGLYFSYGDSTCSVVDRDTNAVLESNFVIPGVVCYKGNEYKVTSIGYESLGLMDVKSVVIPNTVRTIGKTAFVACKNLESVVIPNSVEVIGNEAFEMCSSLKRVEIPSSVVEIGRQAFFECTSLDTVVISKNTKFEENSFPNTTVITYRD